MGRIKNQKTFSQDRMKRVLCRNCGRFIGETHLGEKNTRIVRCKECKNFQIIAPPRLAVVNGVQGAYWCEPSSSCWTALD